MKQVTLGLDQSIRNSGVVVTVGDQIIHYEVVSTEKNADIKLDKFERCVRISNRLLEIIKEFEVERVVIEEIAFAGKGDAAKDLAGLQFVIVTNMMNTFGDEISINFVSPTSLKKFATGSGKADKEVMFQSLPVEVQEEFGKVGKTKGRFDLTDAYFLTRFKK